MRLWHTTRSVPSPRLGLAQTEETLNRCDPPLGCKTRGPNHPQPRAWPLPLARQPDPPAFYMEVKPHTRHCFMDVSRRVLFPYPLLALNISCRPPPQARVFSKLLPPTLLQPTNHRLAATQRMSLQTKHQQK